MRSRTHRWRRRRFFHDVRAALVCYVSGKSVIVSRRPKRFFRARPKTFDSRPVGISTSRREHAHAKPNEGRIGPGWGGGGIGSRILKQAIRSRRTKNDYIFFWQRDGPDDPGLNIFVWEVVTKISQKKVLTTRCTTLPPRNIGQKIFWWSLFFFFYYF